MTLFGASFRIALTISEERAGLTYIVSVSIGPGGCESAFLITAISGINNDGGNLSYQWYEGASNVPLEIDGVEL